jgi:2,4-dienoyl-CoA reductase-like NADH-dependent reductase (Old Yellow Enzyme family)
MSTLFTPFKIGPLLLKNRSIRAAAFEGMCAGHQLSNELLDYHLSVARGGVAMTTIAYAAVEKSGLSFPHQLLINDSLKPSLKLFADKIHQEDTALSIQIGHCGNMSKYSLIGRRPWSATSHINLYAPCFAKAMTQKDMRQISLSFAKATQIAIDCGLDAIEIHAGHGYLISQFLSPYINTRRDEFGGSIENRMKFMTLVMEEVLGVAKDKIAVIVKMNMDDGFKEGMHREEALIVAKKLETLGVHALVLSGGYVSKAPMYVMRGDMPLKTLASKMDNKMMGIFTRIFGNRLIPSVDFKENYFLDDATYFRKNVSLPLIYVGGILSKKNIDEALDAGMDFIAIARALISNPSFINDIKCDETKKAICDTCNHCIAVMYNGPFECNKHQLVHHES